MKTLYIWLVGLLLLAHLPARAQAVPPSVADSLADVARTDTSLAVQRLFRAQRRASLTRVVLGGVVAGSGVVLLAGRQPETTYQRVASVGLGLAAGYYAYQLLDGLVQLRRFRPGREKQVLENLENGQPLPRWARQKLRPSYFSAKVTAY